MSEHSYNSILKRLIATRNAIAKRQVLEGAFDLLAYFAGAVFMFWLIALFIWPSITARVIILAIWAVGAITIAGLKIIKPLLNKKPLTQIALSLEKHYGKLQSRLISSLQLYDKLSDNKENYSIELIEKTIDDAGAEIKDLDFDVAVAKSRRPFYHLGVGVFIIILAMLVSPMAMNNSFLLFGHPFTNISKPANLVLTIMPNEYQAVKNDDVTIKIVASGEPVRQVFLNFKYEDDSWVKVSTEKAESDTITGLYSYTFRKLKRNVQFYAEARGVQSSIGNIAIIDPPRLIDVAITLNYPSYTKLPSQQLPNNDGSITALKGTSVEFAGVLSKPVKQASLVFSDGTIKQATVNGSDIASRFTIANNSSYHVEMIDSAGLNNPSPIEYDIVCLEDYPPQIQITFPGVDIDLDERMVIPIETAVYDDYGFTKLDLVYWTYSEGYETERQRRTISSDFDNITETSVAYDWFVEQLHLLPGDLIYYYTEIFDNDVISGPKSTVSKTFTARLPGLDEIMADISGSQDEIFKDFEETLQNQKELKENLENIARELMTQNEPNWEQKQQLQGAIDKQKEIAEKLNDISQKMDETIEKFEKNQLATDEMMQKMADLRELFEEVAPPELKEAMQKLQEAMANMDPKKLQEAMKNFQLSVEQVNENLDRMMALLQKYQLEQKLDTLAKMAEKLAEQQRQINDKLGECQNKSDFSELQQPQESQKQGLESMKEQLSQAQQLNEQLQMVSKDQMQQADQKLNSEEMNQMMSKMCQSLGQCNKKQSSQSGQKIQQEFKEMSQMFMDMLQQTQQQQQEMITGLIKKAINDVVYLSNNQEDLIDSTNSAESHYKNNRDLARDQNDLKSACSRTANSVADITKETLYVNAAVMERLGAALNSMQLAIEQLNGRAISRSAKSQTEAMTALNQAAAMLMSSLEQASQCQSSGTGMQSLMQKLAEMSQMQQQLNNNSQNMMPMPMPQMMGMAQQQAMQRMAAEQESIRKSLEELMKEYGNQDNVLGSLDKIQQDMKKVVEDMQNQNYSRETIDRQDRILSRLLDAQRSAQRRDYSQKRQARTTDDIIRRGPVMLDLGNNQNEQLSEDIKKALSEKYPRRYENEIREYFKAVTEDMSGE